MCNDCVNTECVDLYVSPCDEGISTGIEIPATGEYTVMIEFNGTTKTLSLNGTEGETFIFPNVLMTPYIHLVRIYTDTMELLNDTCYKFNTQLAIGAGNNLNPTPSSGAKKRIVVNTDGASFTNAFFGLYSIIEIVTNGQSYIIDVDFTQDKAESTITWINGNSFYNGQILIAWAG